MGKVSTEPQYLSQQEFDTKLDTEIGNLIDKGFSDDDILLYTEDFKSRFAVKKKSSGLSEQEPSLESPSETGSLVSPEIETPNLTTKEKKTYLQNLGTNLLAGLNDFNKMVTSIPETVYDLFSLPQNAVAAMTGVEELSTSSKRFKENLGIKNSILDYYDQEGKKLDLQIQMFDQANYENSSVYENIKKGNYQDAFELLGSGITRSAPVSLSMLVGGATMKTTELAGLSTLAFTGPARMEIEQEDPNMSELAKTVKSIGLAGAESVFESIGTGTIGAVYKDIIKKEGLEAGQQIFRNGLVDAYKSAIKKYGALTGSIGEGLEEVATQITQNLINEKDPMEGTADAFLLGFGSGTVMTAPITVNDAINRVKNRKESPIDIDTDDNITKSIAAQRVMDDKSLKDIEEINEKTSLIDKELGKNLPNDIVNELKATKEGLESLKSQIEQSEYEKFKALSDEQKSQLGDIETSIDRIKSEYDAINENTELDVEAKRILLEKKSNEARILLESRQSLLQPTTEQQQTAVEQQVEATQQQEAIVDEQKLPVSEEAQAFANELGNPQDISDIISGGTKVKIGNTNVILKSEGDNIKIESIQTPVGERGQGSGRSAIQRITEVADAQEKTLELNVVPLDNQTDAQQLVNFYESEGFVKDEGFDLDGGRMTRQPNVQQSTTEINNESLPSIETEGNTTTIPINDNTNAEVSSVELENGNIGYEVSIIENGNVNTTEQFADNNTTLEFLNSQLNETSTEQVSEPVPQGESGSQVETNRTVEETAQGFEQNIAAPETIGEESKTDGEGNVQPITNVDIKTPSGLDRAISYLESLENDLDNFGRETLGMNMPVAIAKAAITTMKASLQTVNSMAEAIKAGVDYIKSTDWYKNLNDTDKSNVQDFFESEVLKVPKQEPQPRQTQPFQQREGKKSVFNRIYDGDTDQSLKDAVERNGLDYRIESQEKAQAAAKKFVKNVGVNKALKAVRRNEIKGAEKAFVYAEILDAIANASEGASIEQMSKIQEDYSDITEEALLAFDEEARDAGRFISALNKVYNTSKIKYALTKQVNDYKAANNGFIDDETLAKFKEADKKIRELEDKIDKLEAKRQKEEGERVINDIKEGEQRKKKKGFSKAEAKRVANNIRKAKIHKPGIFSSATPASLVWDGAIETVAKAVEAGGTVAEAIQKGISFIKKSDWYKSLSKANKELAEKEFRNNILDTQEEMSVTINDDGSLRISEQTLRVLVEGGINNIDELAQAVLDIIKQTDPNTEFTVREVRDAITKYGKQINPSKDEINKKIAELKRVGRLMSALEDVVGGRKPKRSGFQRPKPTQTERELMRQVNDAMRDLPMDETEINEAWKTALDRTKTRLQNQIEDLEKQIANKEKRKATREPIKLDEAALELQNKRDALREELDNLVGKPELTEKQKIKRAEAYLQKQVDKLANQIADMDLAFRERQEGVTSQEIERLKNERKSLQEELAKLRNEEGIIERRRLKQAKERLQNQINDYQRRLREGDFSKKETRPLEADKELTELQAEKIKWQEVFEKERYALELKNRTKIEYAKDLVVGILNIPRILMAGGEMSMVLIQGGIQTISLATRNPKALVQTFGKAFMAVGSQRKMDEYASKLKADPNYNLMRQHKLALTEADYKMELREEEFIGNNLVYGIWNYIGKGIEYGSYKLTGVRDMPSIGSSLLSLIKKDVEKNRIPISERIKNMNPLLAFERGNTVYMNEMRRLRFLDGMKKIQMEGKNENDHPQDFRNLARTINTLTGRAEINWKVGKKHLSLESVNDVIGTVFFSFKNTVSVFNQLNPFWYVAQHSPNDPITKPSVAQKIAVRDMLTFVATTTSMMYLLQAAAGNDEDDEPMIDIESDPRSSDFMQLKLKGNSKYIRFDPWHGMRTQVVFFARLFSGEQKTSKGEIKRIGQGYKADTQWDIFTRTYIENKFSPSAAMFYKYMDSEIQEVEGEEMRVRFGEPLSETYKESFYPMYINAVKEIQEEDPNLITSYLTALSFFGLNTGVYGDINDTKYEKKRMTKEEAEKIRLRNARKREQQRRD